LNLTVSCTPSSETAQYQATLVVMTVSPSSMMMTMNFSYSIVCNAQSLVSFDVGAPSLGQLNGGTSIQRRVTFSNQASVSVSLSLSVTIDQSNSSSSRTRSTRETLDDSWVLFSDVATVSLTPGSVTLAPAGAGGSVQVVLSLIPLRPFAHTLVLQLMTPFTLSPASVAQLDWFGIAPLIEIEGNNNNSSLIDLGSVPVGASKVGEGVVSNIGNAVLDLSGLSIDSSSPSWLSVLSSLPHQLLPDELLTITVECMPASTGAFSTTLTLSSSSPLSPELPISVTCVGTASCHDGYRNQGEVDIDCGGPCAPCFVLPPPPPPSPPTTPNAPDSPSSPTPPAAVPPGAPLAAPSTLPEVFAILDTSSNGTNNGGNNNGGTNNGGTNNGGNNGGNNNDNQAPPPLDQPLFPLDTSTSAPTIETQVMQPLATNGSSTTVVVTSLSGLSASVTLSSGAAGSGSTGEATALVIGPASASVLQSAAQLSNVRLGSLAIDVTLTNGVSQLASPAQVCFSIQPGTNYRSACLGYIDSSGRWQCEDKYLTMSNSTQICGSTSHFTNFAVLLSGGGGGGQNKSYITGSWRGDLGLAASVAGFVIVVAVVVLAFGYTQTGRRFISGRQGVRTSMRKLSSRTDSRDGSVHLSVESR